MPYHYPEIWLNSIFVSIASTSTLKCMMLLTYPLLKGGFVLLLCVFVKKILPDWKPFMAFLLALFLGSTTGFYFPFYADSELLKYFDGITQTGTYMSFGRKYIFLELHAGFFIFFLFQRNNTDSSCYVFQSFRSFQSEHQPRFMRFCLFFPLYYFLK
jgi:hypothetical protein